MTKLQKGQQPVSYPGRLSTATATAPLTAAVPYERLPPSTQPPVAVSSAVTPSQLHSPDLPSTNPFSAHYAPQPVPAAAATSSPVSPLVESMPRLAAPTPQRADAAQRQSVDLRRLDGKPYPASSPTEKLAKPIKVAQDMHGGALPPVYRRQAWEPANPAQVAHPAFAGGQGCSKCGRKQGDGAVAHDAVNGCSQCGLRKVSAPEATAPPPPAVQASHARTASEGSQSARSRPPNTTAGPSSPSSSSRSSAAGAACCSKCGRHKRPHSTVGPPLALDPRRPNGNGPATAPIPFASHPALRSHQAGLSVKPAYAGARQSVYPQIDVIPPSASTYKPANSPFSAYGDELPLVGKATKPEYKSFRPSSIVRSLSRRLSKRDQKKATPLPSQQLPAHEAASGEESAGRLINMISSAMQAPAPTDRGTQYSRLDVAEADDRPATPFSFVGGKDEQDAFELVDLRDRGSTSDHDSFKEAVPERITVTRCDTSDAAIPQDTIDVVARPKSAEPYGSHLSAEDAETRPQITRFKSLRSGVSRMNSNISRSQSLKRLGSLKTVHHNWYRSDMSFEGAMGEDSHAVPAF